MHGHIGAESTRRKVTVRARASVPARASMAPRGVRSILDLQRTIGNAATTALVSGLLVQRMELKGAKKAKYRNRYRTWAGKNDDDVGFDEFVAWCHNTSQADDIFDNLKFDEWNTLRGRMTGEAAYELGTAREAHRASAGPKIEKQVDPYAVVKAKIKAEKLDPSKFTTEELATIEAGKAENGWSAAIQGVWQQKTQKEQSDKLAAQRKQRYQQAKTAGDLLFTGGLLRDVWLVAYSVATAGDASPNTTVAQARPDAAILPVVGQWRAAQGTTLGTGQGQVSNFHVPGGAAPIEDKSTRPVNPDPTRGRQADFISTWGNTDINVHVDALPQH